MNTTTAIVRRRSIRAYLAKAVESEKLGAMVNAGNCAPIFGEIYITIIENPGVSNEISRITASAMRNSGGEFMMQIASNKDYDPLYGAPVLILVSAPGGLDCNGFQMANAACAVENMLLAATDMELGSCFVVGPTMAFSSTDIKQKVALPETYVPLCGLLLGYANGILTDKKTEKENVYYCK